MLAVVLTLLVSENMTVKPQQSENMSISYYHLFGQDQLACSKTRQYKTWGETLPTETKQSYVTWLIAGLIKTALKQLQHFTETSY